MNNGLPEFIENNLFSNHFLKERIYDLEGWESTEVEEVFDELKRKYEENKKFLEKDKGESDTQKDFIDFVLEEILGHYFVTEKSKTFSGKRLKPDYLFLESKDKREEILDSDEKDHFTESYVVADAKDWGRKLDKGGTDHTNPAFQIYNYVDRARIRWGILTNGNKWRLYSYEKCDSEVFYEINLKSLLEREKSEETLKKFKFFYFLFRKSAFLPEERGFADKVLEGSIRYSESLEDDLEDKVYDSLEIAMKGFFETNDLEKTEENIELVHHASLIFLYRLLFILNAESRGLLPIDDKAYKQAYGLMQLKEMLIEGDKDNANFQKTPVAWDRISRLFEGINEGYDLHESKIPAYNGGLFDPENGEANKFLSENKLWGTHLKEILKLLATDYDEIKDKRVILDYKDLNIRHLGSVYEGLLEHKFKKAEERKILEDDEWIDFSDVDKNWDEISRDKKAKEGELYLTSDSGERKATGSYYTPEYIVEYIVKNTVGPKVEDKIKEAEGGNEDILDKILELKVCDPAMGSGHFLTEATKFIADKIVESADLTKKEIEDEKEITWAKRKVVQNCIYGVDINPLATELAKLSLWIETMSKGRPLSFLDHHLRTGNSLIGTDLHELSEHPEREKEKREKKGQLTLEDVFDISTGGYDIQKNIKQLLKMYKSIAEISEEDVESIHEKEEIYRKLREHNFRKRFKALADVYTSHYFDNDYSEENYEKLLEAFQPGSDEWDEVTKEEWIRKATDAIENPDEKNLAEEKHFFHWKLEFPEVFFDIKTGKEKDNPGFDAVVGNPPYNAEFSEDMKKYIEKNYEEYGGNYNSANQFIEISMNLTNSKHGMIVPKSLCYSNKWVNVRSYLLEELEILLDAGKAFPGVLLEAVVYIGSRKRNDVVNTGQIKPDGIKNYSSRKKSFFKEIDVWVSAKPQEEEIAKKIINNHKSLADFCKITRGEILQDKISDSGDIPVYRGKCISRYYLDDAQDFLSTSGYEEIKGQVEYLEKKKLMIQNIVAHVKNPTDRIIMMGVVDEEGVLNLDNVGNIFPTSDKYSEHGLCAIFNSSLISWYLYPFVYGKAIRTMRFDGTHAERTPLPDKDERNLNDLSKRTHELKTKRENYSINIQDYLGNYSQGKKIGKIYRPIEGLSDTLLNDTTVDKDKLRIGNVDFEERGNNLVLKVSVRYKPENEDEFDTDQWGYTETDLIPAMIFSVDEKMGALIKEFVPVAVDEAGGFANFKETATKTKSIIDRLEELTLPKLEDVESGLEKFIENKEKAEELEEEIKETDHQIDAIVFDLYDLTEEEVETVLDSLDMPEEEKEDIMEKFIAQ